jgi:hypothetical protein
MSSKWHFSPMSIFGLFMVVVYIGAGLFLFITKKYDYLPQEVRVIFGSFLIIYGIFRGVRVYMKIKNSES